MPVRAGSRPSCGREPADNVKFGGSNKGVSKVRAMAMNTTAPQPVLNSLKRTPNPFSSHNANFLNSPRRTRLQIMLTVSNLKAAYHLAMCQHPIHLPSGPTNLPDGSDNFLDADNKVAIKVQIRPFSENSNKGASVTTSKKANQQI